jgi:hypothetical protein
MAREDHKSFGISGWVVGNLILPPAGQHNFTEIFPGKADGAELTIELCHRVLSGHV